MGFDWSKRCSNAMKHRIEWTQKIERWAIRHQWLTFFFHLYYQRMIREEIRSARVRADHKVLFIGAGPYPWSAIVLAETIKCHVTAIDIDKQAVQQAKQFIKRKRCTSSITVIHEDALDIDYQGFDMIFIARQAMPRYEIIRKALQESEPGTTIIVRDPLRERVMQEWRKMKGKHMIQISNNFVCCLKEYR